MHERAVLAKLGPACIQVDVETGEAISVHGSQLALSCPPAFAFFAYEYKQLTRRRFAFREVMRDELQGAFLRECRSQEDGSDLWGRGLD